ncbi:hypothetical protein BH09BAC2_BH09BAC2_15210 [soil metagenome]
MYKVQSVLLRIIYLFLGLMILYTINRLLFLLINKNEFDINFLTASGLILFGWRFDISAIFMVNSIFFLLLTLPVPHGNKNYFKVVIKYLFLFSNSFFLLLNFIDIAYFPFVHKRLQKDALLFINGKKGNDIFQLLPVFIKQFWYLWLLFAVCVYLLFLLYKNYNSIRFNLNPGWKNYLGNFIFFLATTAFCILGIRGGFQMKPLDTIYASEVTDADKIPLLFNSTFTFFKSLDKHPLEEKIYFNDNQIGNCYQTVHQIKSDTAFTNENVVLIIVESLSREYISYFNGKAPTPFLDSLFHHSLVFDNAFANAKESVQGIPAVLASIPSWENDAFIFSDYSTNKITSIAGLLHQKNYTSAFYHGGGKGTMGFDAFAKLAGFDNYFSREDYNNEGDFDGEWGI